MDAGNRNTTTPSVRIERKSDYYVGTFSAMASPCEVFIDSDDFALARELCEMAEQEAKRIEQKFSRYRTDNIIYAINNSQGRAVETDDETALLLSFAQQCYEISDGLFDITSGILRKVWKFDGSANIPSKDAIDSLLPFIGWEKVEWNAPAVTLPRGMEIDLGGIGKEYAVDKTIQILGRHCSDSLLVNFGGDLHVNGPRTDDRAWRVGIEDTDAFGEAVRQIEVSRGALTTSGDSQRFLLKDGVRYSHVLNPTTGWPAAHAPRSVTVAANSCTEAGILSTLAILKGEQAEEFLEAQDVRFWCQRY